MPPINQKTNSRAGGSAIWVYGKTRVLPAGRKAKPRQNATKAAGGWSKRNGGAFSSAPVLNETRTDFSISNSLVYMCHEEMQRNATPLD